MITLRSTIRLRQIRHRDIPTIRAYLKDPPFQGAFLFGWFTPEDDLATMTEKIDSFLKEKHAYRFFAIEKITDENLIGLVLLQKAEHADCRYVGFYVEPSSRRSGFGMEAMNQLVDYVFRTEKSVDRIEAGTSPLNIPSQKTLEKVGFRRKELSEKTMHRNSKRKDSILYVINRDQFCRT